MNSADIDISRAVFYDQKPIAELIITDETTFKELKQTAITDNMKMKQIGKLCDAKLNESPLKHTVERMRSDGQLNVYFVQF